MTDEELLERLSTLVTRGKRHALRDLHAALPSVDLARLVVALESLVKEGEIGRVFHVDGADFESFEDIPNKTSKGQAIVPEDVRVDYFRGLFYDGPRIPNGGNLYTGVPLVSSILIVVATGLWLLFGR